ncbi:MAG: Gfo/Idh/MocA family oxidoreductase [Alphaproteobacteria bacterium]|nr:Gfo/Idh/MocA family oxidoreductase [Alphaproteobacteria bacterium]
MLNAAIIGLGRWGQVLVESVQGKSEAIRFTAAVTRTPSNAQAFADKHGLPLDDDYAAVLNDPSIEAVVLATPHTQHAEQIVAAAKAGKHVFVEKPFTVTKSSAESAVATAEKAGIVLALGHNRRFLPSTHELNARLQAGDLGTILHVETNFSGDGAMSYTPDGWRADTRESPAGGMGAMGIHMVDMMIHLFGCIREVQTLSVRRVVDLDIDDATSILFRFEDGMTGYLGTIAATVPVRRIEVFGSKGSIEVRDEYHFAHRPLDGEPERIDYPAFDKEAAELEAFAAAVAGDQAYPIRSDEAVHGVAVFEAIAKSAVSGKQEQVS